MHLIFLAARIYPFWALPMAIVVAQLYFFFRRRNSNIQYSALAGIMMLLGGIVAWFFFRGDLNSDQWIRTVVGGN
jgi:ABC-type polysaccharide/polyol phosphate export permease